MSEWVDILKERKKKRKNPPTVHFRLYNPKHIGGYVWIIKQSHSREYETGCICNKHFDASINGEIAFPSELPVEDVMALAEIRYTHE